MYTEINNKYNIQEELGRGAYGVVSSAINRETNQEVAIKKVSKVFNKTLMTKRILREIKLLRLFDGHNNIASLKDLEIEGDDFNEVYVVEDLMEADLNLIIKSKQKLSERHHQYFLYQIAKGMKYIHSADVIHRDLKPGNLLVNSDCSLKICDFGLARNLIEPEETGDMTEYVVTRWYRAPEVMISRNGYNKSLDVWSIGCIFAELLGGKALFKGKDYVDQITKIIMVIGTPSEEALQKVTNKARSFIQSLPKYEKTSWASLFPNASEEALELLERMLQFDPDMRITVDEILQHPYLKAYHNKAKEPVCDKKFDVTFEDAETTKELKKYIIEEVKKFK